VPAVRATQVLRRKHQDADLGPVLPGIHLSDHALACLKAFLVDEHLRPARLQAGHKALPYPLPLLVVVAYEDLSAHTVHAHPGKESRGISRIIQARLER
jgi:hypothetical protein